MNKEVCKVTTYNFRNDSGMHARSAVRLSNSSGKLAIRYAQYYLLFLGRLWKIGLEKSLKVWMTDT